MTEKIYILGGGGHAKVLISTLRANGHQVAAVYDDDHSLIGTDILGVPVAGSIAELPSDFSKPAAIGIGCNQTRRTIAEQFPECPWVVAVHPKAYVTPSARLEPGTVVFAGAVVQSDAQLGEHVIVNTGATIDHDCIIGAYSHIAPGTHLAGQVKLGQGVMAGIGSSVIQNLAIGDWTTLGAGAVAIKDLPAGVTAVGVPATMLRTCA